MWSTAETLAPLADGLRAGGHEVHVPTLPDHAPDLNPAGHVRLGCTSLLDYCAFHEAQLDAAGHATPPVLIGHSMGGLLAQMIAARRPVSGVVLLAPASPAGINIVQPTSTVGTSFVLGSRGFWRRTHRPTRWHARYGLLHRMPETRVEAEHAGLVYESGRAYAEIVFWWADRKRASAVPAEQVTAPMLVLSAAQDRIIPPRVVARVAARYRQAEHRCLDELGHMMFREPGGDRVTDQVRGWLEQLALAADQPAHESGELPEAASTARRHADRQDPTGTQVPDAA